MNIAKILKNAPEGTKLYSPLFGEVEFLKVYNYDDGYPVTIKIANGGTAGFTSGGRYFLECPTAECMLFPSKENRDWSTFKVEPRFPILAFECAEVLDVENEVRGVMGHKANQLKALQLLLICRDAWWKVDNDWKPDWNVETPKFGIFYNANQIENAMFQEEQRILTFRTREIRDKFLETFRDLIEECKEFL